MRVRMTSLSTRNPEPVLDQMALAAGAMDCCCFDDRQRKLLPKLYQRTHVDRRACAVASAAAGLSDDDRIRSFFPPAASPADRGPSTATRNRAVSRAAMALSLATCGEALAAAGVDPDDIDHLVTVSCTGFGTPGVSLNLLKKLGLRPAVSRTHVGFMGCHGAMNGLRAADGLVRRTATLRGRPSHALISATEICSAHFQYGFDPAQVVANALFADGSAAVVLSADPTDTADEAAPPAIEWVAQSSIVIADTDDQMSWHIGDHGFEMYLSAKVPDSVAAVFPDFVDGFLACEGLIRDDLAGWIVHPGGPRIVEALIASLGLPEAAGDLSRDVLRDHGNMSSPTVLFILDRMRRSVTGPVLMVALGPGLTAEVALLRIPRTG